MEVPVPQKRNNPLDAEQQKQVPVLYKMRRGKTYFDLGNYPDYNVI